MKKLWNQQCTISIYITSVCKAFTIDAVCDSWLGGLATSPFRRWSKSNFSIFFHSPSIVRFLSTGDNLAEVGAVFYKCKQYNANNLRTSENKQLFADLAGVLSYLEGLVSTLLLFWFYNKNVRFLDQAVPNEIRMLKNNNIIQSNPHWFVEKPRNRWRNCKHYDCIH